MGDNYGSRLSASARGVWLYGPFPRRKRPTVGAKLRPTDDLERIQTNKEASVRAPIGPPRWDHFVAVIRTFQESGLGKSLAKARAGHAGAYGRLPSEKQRQKFAAATGPSVWGNAGIHPANSIVLSDSSWPPSKVQFPRWLKVARPGHFGDFGVVFKESCAEQSLAAFTLSKAALGSN